MCSVCLCPLGRWIQQKESMRSAEHGVSTESHVQAISHETMHIRTQLVSYIHYGCLLIPLRVLQAGALF